MAPEYAMRGYLTDKADVYSFGIVALELVSGKSNTSYRPKDEFVNLLDWVTSKYQTESHCSFSICFPPKRFRFSKELTVSVHRHVFFMIEAVSWNW